MSDGPEDNNNTNKPIVPDIIHNTIGDFGKWQFRITVMMAMLKLPIAWFQLGNVLLAPASDFYCRKPAIFHNVSENTWKDYYTNPNASTIDACKMPDANTLAKWGTYNYYNHELRGCSAGYEYNYTLFTSTIITEWDLVCDRHWLAECSQLFLLIGMLIGNVIFGLTADRFGRKGSLMAAIVMQSVCGITITLVPWFWAFNTIRFLLGLANGGTMVITFVLCMEIVGGKYRTIAPILYQIPFGIGSAMMALIGYWLRDWRQLQVTLSILSMVFISYFWLCAESPRWLLAVGKRKAACLVLEKAARVNGDRKAQNIRLVFKNEFLLPKNEDDGDKEVLYDTAIEHSPKVQFIEMFKIAKLRRRTLILYLNWFISGIIFFGYSLHLGQVGTNPWLTVGTGGLSIIPGAFLCIFAIHKWGRRIPLIASNLTAAVCLLVMQMIPPEEHWAEITKLVLVMLSAISLAISIPTLYLYTGELFPTIVRNTGFGTAAMFSRIGSLLSPLMLAIGSATTGGLDASFWQNGPPILILLAILSGIEALLILPLPETKDKPLPDTIEEAAGITI